MKKLLTLWCIATACYSCNANKAVIGPGSYISATINGVDKTFAIADSAGVTRRDTIYSADFSAANETSEKMELFVASPQQITTTTYILQKDWNAHVPFEPLLIYTRGNDHYVVDYTGVRPAEITITSITSTNVQGTFSAVLGGGHGADSIRAITNGKFNLNINRH